MIQLGNILHLAHWSYIKKQKEHRYRWVTSSEKSEENSPRVEMLFKLKICLKDRIKPNFVRQIMFRLVLNFLVVNSLSVELSLLILGKGGEQGRFTTLS